MQNSKEVNNQVETISVLLIALKWTVAVFCGNSLDCDELLNEVNDRRKESALQKNCDDLAPTIKALAAFFLQKKASIFARAVFSLGKSVHQIIANCLISLGIS